MPRAHLVTPAALVASLVAPALGRTPDAAPLTRAHAHQPRADSMIPAPRLTVRPREMATGTRTAKAGLTRLDGFPDYYLYVPGQCVGTRRAPLLVLLHGGGRSAQMEVEQFRTLADKYGVIVLFPNATNPGAWDLIYETVVAGRSTPTEFGIKVGPVPAHDLGNIDSAMKLVLRTQAVDPARVAILGFSDGGSAALLLGRSNPDIFSRVAALSALIPFYGAGPASPTTQFFISGGVAEGMAEQAVKMAQVLRKDGYAAATQLGLRGHVDQTEDEDFVWQWLLTSWKDPAVTTRPTAAAPDDSDPVLTVDAVKKMTDFWARLRQAPDSIRNAGRMAHQQSVRLTLGAEPVSVVLTDVPALATAYPSVAADLRAAGLTPQEAQRYRRALVRVLLARMTGIAPGADFERTGLGESIPLTPVAPGSVLGRNLAFRQAHNVEFKALEATNFYVMQ